MADKDFLDEIVAERTAANPEFPLLVEAALRRRQLLRALAEQRKELGLSQTIVAARMHTSQPTVAKLEAADGDVKFSTVERFAAALGKQLKFTLEDAPRDLALVGH
jgi:ribosome-binding protein aMBF1 (putative translation factor)